MASLLELITTEYATEYKSMRYKKPKIYHGGDSYDLSKRWYVYYDFLNPDTNKFVRQKPLYFKINQRFKTKTDRLREFKDLRLALENLLKRGYSPYDEEIENTTEIIKALDFALEIKKREVKQTTYKDYKSRTGIFQKYLLKNGFRYSNIKEIDKKIVNKFLNTIPGAKNRNGTKAALSSIFSILSDNDLIEHNFIKEIRNKKVITKPVKIYSETEIKDITELLKETDYTLLMFVYFVSYMFIRPIELVRLKVCDIDFNKRLIVVDTKTKNNKTKIIPNIIYKDLVNYTKNKKGFLFKPDNYDKWDIGEIDKRNYFTKRFRKFRELHNIDPELKLYSFRHTFITKLYLELRKDYSKEETIKNLSLITGHTSSAIWKYIQVNDVELPDDYSKMLK